MSRLHRFLARAATVTVLLAALAAGADAAAARVESASPLKRYQARLLLREPMHERKERRERARELRELARELKRRGQAAMIARGSRIKSEVPDEDLRLGHAPVAAARRAAPARAAAAPANVRANNPAGDFAGEGQCETAIASYGRYLVAAWNDSKGWRDGTGQTQGWATSTDGGLTWTDQGTLPIPSAPASWKWTSDPVVAVNPTTGAFYYCGLGDGAGSMNGIGVLKGRFSGNTFTWTDRSAARSEDAASYYLDKEWLTVDPVSGAVYLTYTNFTAGLDRIEFQRADSSIASWSTPLKLSAATEDGYVQASRPVVGPGGVVYVTYYAIGLVDVDYLRLCRSTNGGASFSAPVSAVSFYANYGTGAPGFNRDSPIPNFPSIAVDRSTGPYSGRLYLSWAESLNWYDDEPSAGLGGSRSEVEPDDTPATATAMTVGQLVRGDLATSADFDYFKLPLTAGQTILVEADSSGSLTLSLRLFASDGTTRLTWTTGTGADINAGYKPGWIWTAPVSGTYYLRLASQAGVGGYRVRTGFAARATERGTDQRDVFVSHSDNGGASWSGPVRVDDSPVGYDGWLPEVAVGQDGRVFCAWYDWRDAAPASNGGESSIYAARSADGGDTWTSLGAMSDTLSNWTACDSYLAPNQGDYMSLYAGPSTLAVCWSDARGGTPDTYVAMLTIGAQAATATVVSADALPGRVDLHWMATPPDSFRAVIERRGGAAPAWTVLDTLGADPAGNVTYTDTAVEPGTAYDYRLGILTAGGGVTYAGQVGVFVPSGLALATRGVFPNPTDGVNASLSFTLPFAEPALLEVFDLSGRLVHSQSLTGLSAASHTIPFAPWPSARSGVYLVRITQRGDSSTARVVLVR